MTPEPPAPGSTPPGTAPPGTTRDDRTDFGDRSRGPGSAPRTLAAGLAWGRYRLEGLLGEGGMGRVYAAFDPRLERRVALKLLRSDEPLLVERFLAEARAQARVEHEHVCRVYEVGEVEGHPYIAMQLVEGRTLRETGPEMRLEERVELMRKVAEAVHAAHRTGLIHRDVKPGNILVERTEAGAWRPYVADFGIARSADAAGLTRPGALVGTLEYMAPEQAFSDSVKPDHRADIYGLGATLYELLCGRPPVSGVDERQVVMQLLTGDPAPASKWRADLPVDLETIVMKCLERDPYRRYESARALAEDLARFRDGEPILARPTSLAYRLAKRARKHRGVAALAAAAGLAVAVLGGLWLHARWQAGRQASLAQRFGEEVQAIESRLRIAQLLPLHDTAPERAVVRRRMQAIEVQAKAGGRAVAGPGYYALGRGHLALAEPGAARVALERAWQAGYRTPDVSYALGLALGGLYQQALERVDSLADPRQRELERARAESALRDPALAHLRAAGAARHDPAYVEGLIALYDGRFEEARAKARQAFAASPALYEARQLEGEVLLAEGGRLAARGVYDDALARYREAEEAFAAALAIGRSDAMLMRSECFRRLRLLELDILRGGDAEQSFAATEAGCVEALAANSQLGEAYSLRASAHWHYGDFLSDRGGDPRPVLTRAEELAAKALELAPGDAAAASHAGTAAVLLAERETEAGLDPRPTLARAIASFDRALGLDPDSPLAYNEKGLAYFAQGHWELLSGLDPRPSLDRAVEAYDQAIARDPAYANAIHNLALALDNAADYESSAGIDPRPRWKRSIESFERAIALHPNRALFLTNLGGTYIKLGDWELRHGESPQAMIAGAIRSLESAKAADATLPMAVTNLANAYLLQAEVDRAAGADPRAALARCIALNDEVLALQPENALASGTQGQAWAALAGYEVDSGLDASRSIARAKAALAASLRSNPLLKNVIAPIQDDLAALVARQTKARGRQSS